MLLEGRNAVIYGGGGHVGRAVALAFAREGAQVFLAGRTMASLEAVAQEVREAGGSADTAVVDALDEHVVNEHAAAVVGAAGTLDVSMNVIADNDVQGTPIVEMAIEDYLRPIVTAVTSKLITSRAAARQMAPQGSGVILAFGGATDPAGVKGYHYGGILAAFDVVESMRRQLAIELADDGIRVVTLRTSGLPETIAADYAGREQIEASIVNRTLTGRAATFEDVGNVAVFAASDWARTVTGAAINMTSGASLD